MLFAKIRQFLTGQKTIEEKLFWGILLFSILAAAISTVFTFLFEGFGGYAGILSYIAVLMLMVVGIIAKKTGRISTCYFAACVILNVFLFPPLFFECGGFESGIVLNCFMGIFLCTLYNHKKRRFILVLIAVCANEMAFFLAKAYPEWVNKLNPDMVWLDFSSSFLFMAAALYAGVVFLLNIFDRERRERDVLIKKLDFYSKRDPLTKLFNRSYFINYLDKMIWPERKGFYMLKFSVDDFKSIVDEHGHEFGDKVLCGVANAAMAMRMVGQGECVVRYADEDFIQLIYAQSFDEGLQRAEQLRKSVSEMEFEDHPEIRVTISGGFISCTNETFYHQNKMLCVLDQLHDLAKSRGKNQICLRE
jgi:diguanylate cyclase (GGDEF)-like protein